MAHIIINPSLSAAIGYKLFFNPPKFAVVIAILEPANSTRTDNSYCKRNQLSGEGNSNSVYTYISRTYMYVRAFWSRGGCKCVTRKHLADRLRIKGH